MNNSKKYLTTKDFLVSQESFNLIYDGNLDLLRTSPAPDSHNLSRYYESEEYISHTDKSIGLLATVYQLVKIWALKRKTSLITSQNSGIGSVLDVGAGTGDFLRMAKKRGWEVHGTEPSKNAASLAFQKGITLEASVEVFKGKKFDVITLWHVLEHIPNLEETILRLTDLLKEHGTLIIAVPNYKSYDAKYYGKFWAAYDVPRHLWHFSKTSIEKLLGEKFNLEKVQPMIFDAFYVSLLSEKYKSGKSFSLKAFWIGLKSNWKARSTKEYSSHIYCLRRRN